MFAKNKPRSSYSGVDTRTHNSVISDNGEFVKVPFTSARQPYKPELILKLRKERILRENEKQNVHESIAHIMRIFPEGVVKLENEGRDDFARNGDNPKYKVELLGGILTGDIENLKRQGIHISSLHGTKNGNISFTVEIPKKFRISSPKKENKVAFGMRNIGQKPIKQAYHEISSGNINETEQEKLGMLWGGKKLTSRQKKRIDEIDRMADPHEIGLASSPFRERK